MLSLNFNSSFFGFYLPLVLISFVCCSSLTLSFQPSFFSPLLLIDSYSYWLVYVTLVVLLVSSIIFPGVHFSFYFACLLLGFCSYVVFSSSNLFLLYLFFELSLLPIIFIILKWGHYPDRLVSSSIILLYTALFSFPLMGVIFFFFPEGSLFLYSGCYWSVSVWSLVVVFFAFSVKLPIYGLHHWLPMAHVEAPTPGSIILAGVLLNLGGCGLVRFSQVLPLSWFRSYLAFYLIISVIVVSVICLSQSDFNRLVAYSSVVHISVIVLGVVAFTHLSYSSLLLVMVLHGFSSPIMFLLVGIIYSFSNTRLLSLLRGSVLLSPLLSFFTVLAFAFNIPTPPFAGFTAEVFLFLGLSFVSFFIVFFIFVHSFLSILFNSYWLSSTMFGVSLSSYSYGSVTFGEFLALMVFSLNTFLFAFLTHLF